MASGLLNQKRSPMILSAEALEVIAYLESCPGKFVAVRAISRQAGGRRRFEERPGWARPLLSPLVEAGLIEVNERGHFRIKGSGTAQSSSRQHSTRPATTPQIQRKVIGDDYFPAAEKTPRLVGDNYFPQEN
jgi:hypothetical protein